MSKIDDIGVEIVYPPSSSQRVLSFLKKMDSDYIPSVSSLVPSLSEYSIKLAHAATIVYFLIDKKDVGFCAFYANQKDSFISSIGVVKQARSRGVGGKLLEAVINYSRILRMGCIRLEAYSDNDPAMRLYQKYGFEVVQRFENGKVLMKLDLM